ncbi:hypothetical protein D3C73_828110 [compost metagenome]
MIAGRRQNARRPYGQVRSNPAPAGLQSVRRNLLDLGVHGEGHAPALQLPRRLGGHGFGQTPEDARPRLDHRHPQIELLMRAQTGRKGSVAFDQLGRKLDPGGARPNDGDVQPLAGRIGRRQEGAGQAPVEGFGVRHVL